MFPPRSDALTDSRSSPLTTKDALAEFIQQRAKDKENDEKKRKKSSQALKKRIDLEEELKVESSTHTHMHTQAGRRSASLYSPFLLLFFSFLPAEEPTGVTRVQRGKART